jgi:hypothetical protein
MLDYWLKYTYFVKIGQARLQEDCMGASKNISHGGFSGREFLDSRRQDREVQWIIHGPNLLPVNLQRIPLGPPSDFTR